MRIQRRRRRGAADENTSETKSPEDGESGKKTSTEEKKKKKKVTGATQALDGDNLDKRLKDVAAEMTEGELDPESVSMDMSLVELGLGSMQVVQLGGQIGEEFGIELDEEELFSEDMTLGKMKRLILTKQSGGAVPAPKVKPLEMEPYCGKYFCCRCEEAKDRAQKEKEVDFADHLLLLLQQQRS